MKKFLINLKKRIAIFRKRAIISKSVMPLARKSFIFGPVAQLGERSVRIREVESSSLFRSTTNKHTFVYRTKVCF